MPHVEFTGSTADGQVHTYVGDFEVTDGVLVIRPVQGNLVITHAPGYWTALTEH